MKVDFNKMSVHATAEESPGFLLWQISTLWRRKIEAVLKPLGLTHPQFVILATIGWLTREGGRATQAAISRHAALDPNTISQIVRGLETKGLVERQKVKTLSKYPLLTKKGASALAEAMPLVEGVDALFFGQADLVSALKTFEITDEC